MQHTVASRSKMHTYIKTDVESRPYPYNPIRGVSFTEVIGPRNQHFNENHVNI